MTRRVLVTGATGFAGQYIAPALARGGYEVHGTTFAHPAKPAGGIVAVHAVDLTDAQAVSSLVETVRPTHIVHLAAISFVGHGDVGEIYATNVVGTRNLLKAASELSETPQSVLLMSSANIYGNSEKGVLDENEPFNPANDYAVSKVAMELMARQFADRLPLSVVRPFNYTGRGQGTNFLVPKIVSHFIARADHIELGNIDVSRDFSDVRTVADICLRLLASPAAGGQTVNICSGVAHSLKEIIAMCSQITGHSLEVRVNPAFVRRNEVKTLIGDTARLKSLVGDVANIPLHDTLSWMLES